MSYLFFVGFFVGPPHLCLSNFFLTSVTNKTRNINKHNTTDIPTITPQQKEKDTESVAREVYGGGGLKRYKEEGREGIQKGRKTSREERPMILTSRRKITSNIKTRQENVYIF